MSVVLISGANSGIGQLAALAFARAGHAVAAGSRSLVRARELQNAAAGEQLRLTAIHLDVTDPESIADAVKETEDRFGPVDVLVNNAGVVAHGAVEMVSEDTVRTTFETNFYGPLRLVKAVLPSMRSRGQGAIVLVGSLQGILPSPGAGVYGASKVAAAALNDALACEVEPLGIHVVTVEVGPYRTGIEHKQSFEPPQPGPYGPLLAALGRRGALRLQESADPGEVAKTIVALAFRPDPPLRVPVGVHAQRYLSGPTVADRFRDDLRAELAALSRESAAEAAR